MPVSGVMGGWCESSIKAIRKGQKPNSAVEFDSQQAQVKLRPSQLWPLAAFPALNVIHQVLLEEHIDLDQASAQGMLSTLGSTTS